MGTGKVSRWEVLFVTCISSFVGKEKSDFSIGRRACFLHPVLQPGHK
jgi:hypothetical protein